jgi:hypothetical protein
MPPEPRHEPGLYFFTRLLSVRELSAARMTGNENGVAVPCQRTDNPTYGTCSEKLLGKLVM